MSEHPASMEHPETNTKSGSDSMAERVSCPLCSFTAPDESTLSAHLKTSHRKSMLAQALVETI